MTVAERLERGEVIYYPVCPYRMPDESDRTFLAAQDMGGPIHKNISYDPVRHRLHGHVHQSQQQTDRLLQVLSGFSESVTEWLSELLPGYAPHWETDRVSYRPLEEATRQLRLNVRNDLLHVDAFPTRPTNGWRILRVFLNVNFSEPRIWITSDTFGTLLKRYGRQAGLPVRGFRLSKAVEFLRDVPRLFRPGRRPRSEYDSFMHRFHNFLKANEEFQEKCVKKLWTFPSATAWMAMTDTVSHAVLRGRFALEHSFFIARSSLVLPDESPAALLEQMCGFPVLNRQAA